VTATAKFVVVVVVFLRIEEHQRAALAVLRCLDEHLHRDLLVDPVDGFQGLQWHGRILLSMLGQENRQREEGVLDPLDRERLPRG
jgi:hypothetical protein